jgi:hypothetical protein
VIAEVTVVCVTQNLCASNVIISGHVPQPPHHNN